MLWGNPGIWGSQQEAGEEKRILPALIKCDEHVN